MLPNVADLKVKSFKQFRDVRGVLVPIEILSAIPFALARFFWVFDVPVGISRGAHAHQKCHQFYVCASGAISVEAYDGESEKMLHLTAGDGLYVPPAMFTTEIFKERSSILLVFCDRLYEADDYIRDRADLKKFRPRAGYESNESG
jgi:dTDP-4-dehydrorhamnose 3,5-epimerase-like enzyme